MVIQMQKKVPMSLRLDDDVEERLEECSKRLKMRKHTLAQAALEAGIEAIEKNGYKLVFPLEFEVKHIAIPNPKSDSTSNPEELTPDLKSRKSKAA
jgi:predicted DNA-binding protein